MATYGHVPVLHVAIWPRKIMQLSTWPLVVNTRVQSATSVYYTCLYGRVKLLHVAMWTRVITPRGHLFCFYK
jgi:homoserine trans-succinylase